MAFSTITIAWSTRMPIEMAMPESDMMFEAMPKCRIRMNETSTASGSVMQISSALRKCIRISRIATEAMIISSRERLGERVDGAVDQPRAVVEGHDPHAFGQARLKLLNLVLDPPGDVQRVLAVPHHHHGPDGLVAVLLQHAAAELAPPGPPWPGWRRRSACPFAGRP